VRPAVRRLAVVGALVVALLAAPAAGDARAEVTATVDTPDGVATGHVEVDYRLIDAEGATASVELAYSTDGGRSWRDATEGIGSHGTARRSAAPAPGASHRFVWDSFADVGERSFAAVRLRVSPDGRGAKPGETGDFPLQNAGPVPGIRLVRGPYLQSVTTSRALVVWRTAQPTEGRVLWGEKPALGRVADSGSGGPATEHAVSLEGLAAGRHYFYRVAAGDEPLSPLERFRAAPAPEGAEFSFLVFGDSGKGNQEQWDIAQRMELAGGDFAIHTGDIVYNRGEYEHYDPRFFAPYRAMLARLPIFPSLGNHDVLTERGRPFVDHFHLPSAGSGTEKYYTFAWGNAQLFCLDSSRPTQLLPGLAQHRWLRRELARSKATWRFVYFHHPPYSSGVHGSDILLRGALSPLFERAGVDIVFNGHDHDYERTTPRRDYEKDAPRGTVYVVTGAGGALRTQKPDRNDFTVVFAAEQHFTRVRIRERTLKLEAIRLDGSVLDAFELSK